MHSPVTPPPVELGRDAVVHLGAQLEIATLAVTAAFWTHDPTNSPQLTQGRILSVYDYTTTWAYWERHPDGDELVYVLSGKVGFVLDNDEQRHTVTLRAGETAIVPAGTWHRALIHAPAQILFVTPTPARTQQRLVTPPRKTRGTGPAE
jgi:mannose-6-phosphate isomerase-like protein (cupin superfamily)